MKGCWKYFWSLYTLFFAVPFPMIIYYSTSFPVERGSAPWLALFFLLLSVVAWGLVLWSMFSSLILAPFRAKRDIDYLLANGTRKEAVIVESARKGAAGNGYIQSLTVSLRNFSGAEIREHLELVDSRPEERRFEEGKRIALRIDERLKTRPVLIPEEASAGLRPVRLAIFACIWLLVAAAIGWYYIYSYRLQSNGSGWRFLAFYHPLVLCPLILLVTKFGFSKLVGMMMGMPRNSLQLKYYGRRTDAKVISASKTGTYINKQPQVRFELRYTDDLGQQHETSVKKVVPLINIGMTQMPVLPIFYLQEKPMQVAFASDLDS